MVRIDSLLSKYLSGDLLWVEGVLYASFLGSRLGVGSSDPKDSKYSVLRLANFDWSIYDEKGFGSDIPTAFLESDRLIAPPDPAQFRSSLGAVCAVAAHESCHHRIHSQFTRFAYLGLEIDSLVPPAARATILEQLGVRSSMQESGIPMQVLRGYWAASAKQMQSHYPEINKNGAAFLARSEFFCETAACLARLRLLRGPSYVWGLLQDLKVETVVPNPVPELLAEIFYDASAGGAEEEAREEVKKLLANATSSATLLDRHQQIVDGLWPSDLSKTIEWIYPPAAKTE